jgi:hypothetical protein
MGAGTSAAKAGSIDATMQPTIARVTGAKRFGLDISSPSSRLRGTFELKIMSPTVSR